MTAAVRLNIYDMYWMNEYVHPVGFGIYHSGIEIHGVEYAYGGHQFPFSGIFTNSPQDAEELGETFKFKESIYLGECALSKKSVEKLVKSMGDEFRGDRYHLITRNCNHFSAYFAKELTGVDIPGWVNRLASFSGSIPFLQKIIPHEWLTPMALEHSLEIGQILDRKPVTLNYPSALPVDEAIDALEFNNSCQNGETIHASSSTNGLFSNSNRRNSSIKANSAPTSSRSNGSTTPSLSRLWNSIKGIATDEFSNSRPTNNK